IQAYVDHYNTVRLHSAIGYVTPHDMLAGRQAEIHAARDRKLEEARTQRQFRRVAAPMLAPSSNTTTMTSPGETEAGSAGMQPCWGIPWWDSSSRCTTARELILPRWASRIRNRHRTIDPHALKIPAPAGAESSLTENVTSPFQAEPAQYRARVATETWSSDYLYCPNCAQDRLI